MANSPWLMVALVQVVVLVAFASVGAIEADEQHPLPFDPLSDDEEQQAIEATLSSERVSDGERFEVIGAALYTDKAFQEMDTWPRIAETWVYDYEQDVTIRTLVDLDEDLIVLAEEQTIQPPLTASEKQQAGTLALSHETVHQELAHLDVEKEDLDWIAGLWTGEAPTACPETRCALVGFMDGTQYHGNHFVVVNLSQATVRDIITLSEDASDLRVEA